MSQIIDAGEHLLDAWLSLTSTLWNTRIVSSLSYNEAHVMGILLHHSTEESPMTATDLIRRTRLLKSQMNKILTALEKQGYIHRVRSKQDKRMIHVFLTAEGEAAYLHEHQGVEVILEQLVSRIGTERALAVSKDLFDIVDALEDIVPSPGKTL